MIYLFLFYFISRTSSNQNERPHYNRYEHGYYGSSCTPVEEEFIPAADDYNNINSDENNGGDENEPKNRLAVGLSDGTTMHEKILVLKNCSFSNSSEKKSNEPSSKSNKSNNNRLDNVDV